MPAIRGGDRVIHFDVQLPQLLNVRGAVVRVVKAVVGGGQAFPPRLHDALAVRVVAFADGVEAGEIQREGEIFKTVSWGVVISCTTKCRTIVTCPNEMNATLKQSKWHIG